MNITGWNVILAQCASPGGGQGGQGSGLFMFIPMIIIFLIFYLMMIKPQMKKEKERKKMIANVKTGDRILFAGGILGTIVNVKDQIFVVKIADNVKIDIARGSVLRVLQKDEEPGEMDKAN